MPEDRRVEMISDTKLMHEGALTRELCRLLRVSRATTPRTVVKQSNHAPVPLGAVAVVAPELEPVTIKSSSIQSEPVRAENIFLRDEIEQLVLKHPWHGYRRINKLLARKGIHVNRKRMLRIMQLEKLIYKRKKCFVPKPRIQTIRTGAIRTCSKSTKQTRNSSKKRPGLHGVTRAQSSPRASVGGYHQTI
jgi:HTH-like domain